MNPLLIGSLLGAIKGMDDSSTDRAENAAQQKYGATAIRLSPWSGIDANSFANRKYHSKSDLSGLIQGAGTGLETASSIQNAGLDSGYKQAVIDRYLNKESAAEDSWSGFTPDKNAGVQIATKVKSPYSAIYNAELGYEPDGKDNVIDLLKGQARRSFGNA